MMVSNAQRNAVGALFDVASSVADVNRPATTAEVVSLAVSATRLGPDQSGAVVRAASVPLHTLVCHDTPFHALSALAASGALAVLVPEVAALDLDQGGKNLHKDNLVHSLAVCAQAPPRPRLRWAALLHDIGKAPTRSFASGKVTFHNHEVVGARLTLALFARLGYQASFAAGVAHLVYTSGRTHGDAAVWSDRALRRFAREIAGPDAVSVSVAHVARPGWIPPASGDDGIFDWATLDHALLDDALDLSRVDCTSGRPGRRAQVVAQVDDVAARIAGVAAADGRALLRPALDGHQIGAILGIGPGAELGAARTHLLSVAAAGVALDEVSATTELHRWWAARLGAAVAS